MKKLSHIDTDDKAQMVDISDKTETNRIAAAMARVNLNEKTYWLVKDNQIAKGDVLTVAKIAGIQAAKKTDELIPLCHRIPLDVIDIEFELNDNTQSIKITATAKTSARTGVEMEALTACSMAALTIYDMVKVVQKDVTITDLKLLKKSGGKSGAFQRKDL